jgi:hypothetical protein
MDGNSELARHRPCELRHSFRLKHAVPVRIAMGILFAWLAYFMLAQVGDGTLIVEIRDKGSGQIVPAMVCITSLAEHKWRTPPDGRVTVGYSTTRDFYNPGPWKPGDIGPVRLTIGDYGDNDVRSLAYAGESAYPFWREPAAYFVANVCSQNLV